MSLLDSLSGNTKDSSPWSGLRAPTSYWDDKKRKKPSPRFGLFKNDKQSKTVWPNFGPGGGLGIGCGAGVGIGITGGAGVGAVPWNALRIVVGVGFGCGVGLGYGYGQGFGVLWDRRPKKDYAQTKRVVIEI